MFTAIVLWGMVLPAVVASIVLAAGWRPWNRRAPADRAGLASGALAFGGALIATELAIVGVEFPPIQASDWLALLVAAAVLVGLADSLLALPAWLRWSLKVATSAALALLLLMPLVRQAWSAGESAAILVGLAAGVVVLWWSLDLLAERAPGAGLPFALGLLIAGAAVALAVAGAASLGQIEGGLAVAMGVAFLIGLVKPTFSLARGAVGPLAVGLAGLWTNGTFYADLPTASLVLLLASPAFALVGELGPLARLEPWQRALLRTGAILVPLAVAAALAWAAGPPAIDEASW